MSFSTDVKNELAAIMPNARHCRLAELAAFVCFGGVSTADGGFAIRSESRLVTDRFCDLYRRLFPNDLLPDTTEGKGPTGKTVYSVAFSKDQAAKLLAAVKAGGDGLADPIICQQPCCKRAYLRGAFITSGSMTDPEKDYHLEFVTSDDDRASELIRVITAFGIEAKPMHRKKYSVVYLKDGEGIVDILNVTEAHVGLMNFENVRILKEMRNSVNRRVNCEAANIDKTVKAAGRQIDDINYIGNTIGLDGLNEELKETAQLRLQNPEASLTELGRLHKKPVGRSGVNHRLKKLSEMAELLRSGKPVHNVTEG